MDSIKSVTRANTSGLGIHPELNDYLPTLEADEIQQLRRNLERVGCLDAILYWKDGDKRWIVDGANRWSLCCELGIPFKIRALEFESLDDIKVWMVDHQQGRRNLTQSQIAQLHAKRLREKEIAARKKAHSDSEIPMDQPISFPKENSVREAAREAKVSEPVMSRAMTITRDAVPEVEEAVIKGQMDAKEAVKIAQELPHRQREKVKRGQTKATQPKLAVNTKDELGEELPVDLHEHFAARGTFDELLKVMTKLSTLINPLLGDPQANRKPAPGGERLADHRTDIKQLIERLRGYITISRPYVPCGRSHKSGRCQDCAGCGWMTEKAFKNSGIK